MNHSPVDRSRILVGLLVAAMASAVLFGIVLYDQGIIYGGAANGGIHLLGTCGIELWGHPGFFCGNY